MAFFCYSKRAGERLYCIGGNMTAQEIKALPRTEEGIFDLNKVQADAGLSNIYQAADMVYPVYAAFETTENKKEGYPDIMAQMRVLKKHAESEFTAENGADYTAALLHTVEQISPEIYENYRELLDNFRSAVKRMLEQYYDAKENKFAMDDASKKVFCDAVQKACAEYLLLAEKYQECLR